MSLYSLPRIDMLSYSGLSSFSMKSGYLETRSFGSTSGQKPLLGKSTALPWIWASYMHLSTLAKNSLMSAWTRWLLSICPSFS